MTDLEVGYSENACWTFRCDHHEQLAFPPLVAVVSRQPYDLAEAHLQEHADAMDVRSFLQSLDRAHALLLRQSSNDRPQMACLQ